jgi:hypothetical protein
MFGGTMSYKQEDVERFERDWDMAEKFLSSMLASNIVKNGQYQDLKARIRSLDSMVTDISLMARSDKD